MVVGKMVGLALLLARKRALLLATWGAKSSLEELLEEALQAAVLIQMKLLEQLKKINQAQLKQALLVTRKRKSVFGSTGNLASF